MLNGKLDLEINLNIIIFFLLRGENESICESFHEIEQKALRFFLNHFICEIVKHRIYSVIKKSFAGITKKIKTRLKMRIVCRDFLTFNAYLLNSSYQI